MKLYHWPGSCSTGIHILLHEIGAPFDTQIVNLGKSEQKSDAYKAVSPKGKVPSLVRDDGSLLTEFQTIAMWLAKAHPDAGLLPATLEGETRVLEALDYMVGSIHMRGFTFILATGKFMSDPDGQAVLKDHGRAIVNEGFGRLADMLGDQDYLFSDFTIADAALFYLEGMASRGDITLPPAIQAHHARMAARPAVAATLAAEESA